MVLKDFQVWYNRTFFRKVKKIPAKMFLTIGDVNKDITNKRNFADNHGHDISRLFDIVPNFALTISETKRDY